MRQSVSDGRDAGDLSRANRASSRHSQAQQRRPDPNGNTDMQLPYHDRYAYSPIVDRPDYSWPDGKRLAVYIGLNIEHFAFGAGEGHLLTVAGAAPDSRTFAWRDYGNRVGVWRCLQLFDELKVPAAALINTSLYDYCPDVGAAWLKRGD